MDSRLRGNDSTDAIAVIPAQAGIHCFLGQFSSQPRSPHTDVTGRTDTVRRGSGVTWFLTIVVLLVLAGLGVLFLNRYYRKATREGALVRTGLGGQRVVLDGGCLALPFLHKVSEVNMRTSKLEIERLGPHSVITRDRLRVDVGAEFHVRVEATEEGVATAAQALAGKTFRAASPSSRC